MTANASMRVHGCECVSANAQEQDLASGHTTRKKWNITILTIPTKIRTLTRALVPPRAHLVGLLICDHYRMVRIQDFNDNWCRVCHCNKFLVPTVFGLTHGDLRARC